MPGSHLSVTEFAVLGVLAEKPSHGFAIAKELEPTADLGRVFTVRRPLVYRALDRMADIGYVETATTEPGAGPQRVVYRVTRAGRRRLRRWRPTCATCVSSSSSSWHCIDVLATLHSS